jgi:hypothetical protein
VTYVPDHAPVRQKTLFASTRLTLTRELGSENFTESVFCTLKEELTEEGWKRHEAHEKQENPLTEEERNLEGIKEAEVLEVGGTGRRGGGYGGPSGGLKMNTEEGVVEALSGLQNGSLVMLVSWHELVRGLVVLMKGYRKSTQARRLCLRKLQSVQWIHQPLLHIFRQASLVILSTNIAMTAQKAHNLPQFSYTLVPRQLKSRTG